MAALYAAIRNWTLAQIPDGAAGLDQLICDGKILRGSIEPNASGGSTFIAQVTLIFSSALGVAISHDCYATDENNERAVLNQLLGVRWMAFIGQTGHLKTLGRLWKNHTIHGAMTL